MNIRPLVLYHANCPDGFCAAWVAYRAHISSFGCTADFLPVQYGEAPPSGGVINDREVYILDFSYPRKTMINLVKMTRKLTILDHHKTAKEELAGLTGEPELVGHSVAVTFSEDKSGGRLAWEHFFPDQTAPWLVHFTEDRDLWRWKLPFSRELNAAIASYPHDFDLWDKWAGFTNETGRVTHRLVRGRDYAVNFFGDLVREGVAILRYQQQVVDNLCLHAVEVEIGGHRVLCVNTPVLQSEVAGKLAEGRPFGACYFINSSGKKIYSLRSDKNGVDVSEIARLYGGGGHRAAAGFVE